MEKVNNKQNEMIAKLSTDISWLREEVKDIKNNHLNCIYKELREIREGLMRRPSWFMAALVAALTALITYVLTSI